MSETPADEERGGSEHPAPVAEPGIDPLEAARKQARLGSEGSGLPSETGLGPGAGEIPVASVSAGASPEWEPAPANPSMGKPPRSEERPQARSSQLDEGGD